MNFKGVHWVQVALFAISGAASVVGAHTPELASLCHGIEAISTTILAALGLASGSIVDGGTK